MVNTCLAGQRHHVPGQAAAGPDLDGLRSRRERPGRPPDDLPTERIESCVTQSKRAQLDPYVAPPARLFVNTPSRAEAGFDLSPANQKRIAGVAAAVLLITVIITVAGGFRLVQPLRALTRASRRMTGGDESIRVRVRGSDEIGQLSAAFNELADSRARTESLRRAMVSDIAHELRTPLSNIRGWLEAVEDGVTKPDEAFIALAERGGRAAPAHHRRPPRPGHRRRRQPPHPPRARPPADPVRPGGRTYRSQAEHADVASTSCTQIG